MTTTAMIEIKAVIRPARLDPARGLAPVPEFPA
jgi:hypothetical protein